MIIEQIAEILYYQQFRKDAKGKVLAWESVSDLIRGIMLEHADEPLSLLCAEIGKMGLTDEELFELYAESGQLPNHDMFVAQAQLQKILKELGGAE